MQYRRSFWHEKGALTSRGMALFFLGIAAVLLAPPSAAFGKQSVNGDPFTLPDNGLRATHISSEAPGLPERLVLCRNGDDQQHPDVPSVGSPACIEPEQNSSSTESQELQSLAAEGGATTASVTNEAGDIIEVRSAFPGVLYRNSAGSLSSPCIGTVPYLGSIYGPCAWVYAYDSALETDDEIPMTNYAEQASYDACGNKVSGAKMSGFHIAGKTYWDAPSWAGGIVETIPSNHPVSCLGTWTLVFSYTQTFSNGETLTDTRSSPFLVTEVPILPSSTWGGGNPSELPCAQACIGDPVNSATGDYFESQTDLAISGRGPGLQMTRTYSSLAAKANESSVLGRGWAFSYGMRLSVDPEKGIATITNVNGSKTQFDPGKSGSFVAPPRVLAKLVKNGDGTYTYTVKAQTIYTFDATGKLTSIADLNGNKTTLAYNASGQLQTVTDSSGRTFTFAYHATGKLASVTDSTGRKVSYAFNAAGLLEDVTNVRGGHSKYTYDPAGLLLTHKDARENTVVTNTYDSAGRVLTQVDGLKSETKFAYAGSGDTRTTDVTNPRGYVTRYEYFKGSLVKRIEAMGTESSATWAYKHDPITLGITEITDPNGHTSYVSYDARGNQTSTEDALGHTTKSKYDALSNLLEFTDENGVTTTHTYNASGNRLSSSTPLVGSNPPQARTVTYTYGNKSFPEDVTAVTDPNGKTTSFAYDAAGNLTSETDAAGNKATFTYDTLGRRLTKVSPRGYAKGGKPAEYTTTYTYDAEGNRLSTTDPLGHKRSWTYDANGNVETMTDANGYETSYAYDAANRQVAVTRDDGSVKKTAYDGNGNVLSKTNGLEQTTSYAYDPRDYRSSATDPLLRTTSYLYDAVGNLKSTTDPESRTTTFTYDDANRLTEVSYSDGVTPMVKYGYDAAGHRTSMTDGTGSSSFSFDSLGRLTGTANGHGETTAYGYDLAGNKTSIVYPNGKKVTRTFDSAERLASVTDWLGNTTSFAYDADSNLASITFPTTTTNVDTYSYDRADMATGVTMSKGKTTLASLSYTRDNNGQLLSEASTGLPGGAQSFTYDGLNRLTKAASGTYAYDKADNPTTIAGVAGFGYDVGSQLTEGQSTTYSYNQLGQRTGATPAAGAATTYSYDQAGQLTGVARPKEGEVPAIEDTFAYDGTGLRAAKTAAGVTSHFVWDTTAGLPLLLTENTTSYIYGPYGLPIERIDGGGNATFFHHDVQGSTRALTNTSGATVATYSYDPYGNLTGQRGRQALHFSTTANTRTLTLDSNTFGRATTTLEPRSS